MKVEALGSLKSDGYVLDDGDVKTVPDDIGTKWCAHGWAKDLAGVVATGERVILNANLVVDSSTIQPTSTTVGVS